MNRRRKPTKKTPSRTPQQRRPAVRRPSQPDAGPGGHAGFPQLVASVLTTDDGDRRWAGGRNLGPLPSATDQLLEAAHPALMSAAHDAGASTRSLQQAVALGYGLLGTANKTPDTDAAPTWLLERGSPVDVLDLMFFGAVYPKQLTDPVEFAHARDLWLDHLSRGPYRDDLARMVAACVDVADELDQPIDSVDVWLGTVARLSQAGIGTRPLAAAAMPARMLASSRMAQPPSPTEAAATPADHARADSLVSYLTVPVDTPARTVEEALRHGLAVMAAAVLDEHATIAQLHAATGPMFADDAGHGASATVGPAASVSAADDAEMTLNETLAVIDHPAAAAAAHTAGDVRATVDALPATVLLGALRVGVAAASPRGTQLRRALPWALGLLPDSPLVQVTDPLVAAVFSSQTEPAGMRLLAQVCATDLSAPIDGDTQFRGTPGTALIRLASAAGVPQVETSQHTVQRVDEVTAGMLGAQHRLFVERFGREPRPDEPLFFDPNADEPTPLSLEAIDKAFTSYYQHANVSHIITRASSATGLPVPLGGQFSDERKQQEWDDAVDDAIDELGIDPDEAYETVQDDYARLDGIALLTMMSQMAGDDTLAGEVVGGLRRLVSDLTPDDDIEVLTGPGFENTLPAVMLRWHPELLQYASRHPAWNVSDAEAAARRWADLDLARQVRELGVQIQALPGDVPPNPDLYGWELVPAAAVLLATSMRR